MAQPYRSLRLTHRINKWAPLLLVLSTVTSRQTGTAMMLETPGVTNLRFQEKRKEDVARSAIKLRLRDHGKPGGRKLPITGGLFGKQSHLEADYLPHKWLCSPVAFIAAQKNKGGAKTLVTRKPSRANRKVRHGGTWGYWMSSIPHSLSVALLPSVQLAKSEGTLKVARLGRAICRSGGNMKWREMGIHTYLFDSVSICGNTSPL